MNELPRGWCLARLGDVADVVRGVTYKKADARTEGQDGYVPLLRATNISMQLLLDEELVYIPEHEVTAAQRLRTGDLVLVASSGSASVVGKSAMLSHDWEGTFGAFCSVIRAGDQVLPQFLAFFASSPSVRRRWSDAARGTNINNLKVGDLVSTPVPLPPLSEQRRIVELLEDHLSRLDAGERYLRSVVSRRDAAHGAVMQAALFGADAHEAGDVLQLSEERHRRCPPGMKRGRPVAAEAATQDVPWRGRWPTVSLEAATDPVRTISYGILKPGPNLPGGVPYVRVLNMRKDVLAADDLHRTTPEIASQYARASLEGGDVLISIRGTYGRVVLVPEQLRGANITQDTARLAVLPPLEPSFVALVLRSPWAQAHLRKVARGVGVKGVNITDLREVPMPLPNVGTQARIVRDVEARTSELSAAARSAELGLRRASTLRQSLLSAAFSGRLTCSAQALEASHV